jgi:predicted acylesterase/phospholipase RssA
MSNHDKPRETGSLAIRRMPVIAEEKRIRIFERMRTIQDTIIKENQGEAFLVSVSRAISDGDYKGMLDAFSIHPVSGKEIHDASGVLKGSFSDLAARLVRFQKKDLVELLKDKQFSPEKLREYRHIKAKFVNELVKECPSIPIEIPATFHLTLSALNILPQTVMGKTEADTFSSKMAWIGREVSGPEKPGRIALVLSGGAAKGVFYLGFIRALRENGIWPDIVVGNSAGALASAGLASGKPQQELEDAFTPDKMKRIFSPFLAPLTFLASAGNGVIGLRYGAHLKKVFGESRFSKNADCFVIVTVQQPTGFGRTVIGRSTDANGSISLSSDIPLYEGVWGSSTIPGLIPQPKVRPFTAERLEHELFGTDIRSMELPYATFDDGGVTENLPLESTDLMLGKAGLEGLMIMVNLSNLSPAKAVPPAQNGRGLGGMLRRMINESAPMRAYNAFENMFNSDMVQGIEASSGRGLKILLNPNCDGSLDGINIITYQGYDAIREYGYSMGKKLCDLLLPPKP